MAKTWTSDQKKVIELHDRNILVSAAAGSGKTAVLVERIIQMVTDEDKKIDIDRLVVVTFTKAAAGEMKQRISDAIEEKIETNPDNERLQRQLTLINNAQITTIDSFCLGIVRNYFVNADIDPGFRTADEGELKLLETDVLDKMMEEYYGSDRKEFFDFVDAYGAGRDDSAIEDVIKRLYRFSRSYPWPLEWLHECNQVYDIKEGKALNENASVQYLTNYVKSIIGDYDMKYEQLEKICDEADGPNMYKPMIMSDRVGIDELMKCNTFDELGDGLKKIEFARLSSKKSEEVDLDKKEYVKAVRDRFKKSLATISKKIFAQSAEANFADIQNNKQSIQMMVELTTRFYQEMQTAKKDKNIIDFNDMEHLALDILVKKVDGKIVYTSVADSLSEFYEEILIDEYQDSNYLQEEILHSISKGRVDENRNNVFMVGDVKQSIYKFRLARPDIFTNKYHMYTDEDSKCQKIELSKNFRSRGNVLDTINDVFFNIMRPYVGGIDYNAKVMLNTGLEFVVPEDEDIEKRTAKETELIVVHTENKSEDSGNDDCEDMADREVEALSIANRIAMLTDQSSGMMVYDSKKECYRVARYHDIVILTRTVSGWADLIVNGLMNQGIPAYSDTSSGYFGTREIKLLLSMLAIIDNPLQDIPLAAVLTSYFGGFTADELALMRNSNKKVRLYTVLVDNVENSSNESGKVDAFLKKLDIYRKMSEYTTIHDLVWKIVYDTGFYDYVASMPAGIRRQANVDMLMEKAKSFEKTSYTGLFNFLKYIEKLQKYDVDYGEATVLGENENLVRVMSIHKSKGLEFPVVILAGMSKKFNNMDSNATVVIDADLGIGAVSVDLEHRTKNPTIIKNAIGYKLKMDNLSEELRVLYVAMTRAKEKLIMIGTVKNLDKSMTAWRQKSNELYEIDCAYSFADLEGCSSYFDLVVPTALKQFGNTGKFRVDVIEVSALDRITIMQDSEATENSVGQDRTAENHDAQIAPYPYADVSEMKAKITVSELKKMQHDQDMEQTELEQTFAGLENEEPFVDESIIDSKQASRGELTPIVPKFIVGQTEFKGTDRGTAYHRIMECLDYGMVNTVQEVVNGMQEMLECHKITKEQFDAVEAEQIYSFAKSPIGRRVRKAYHNKCLKREQPFVYGIEQKNSEIQLVQGVVDLYMIEEDKIVIVDYKTDRVSNDVKGEAELVKRYKIQLDYYGDALSRLLNRKVAEKVIYSFCLDKEIIV